MKTPVASASRAGTRNLPPLLPRPAKVTTTQPHATGGADGAAVLLVRVEQSRVFVGEFVQLHALDLRPNETLDAFDVRLVLGAHDGEGVTARLGASGAPDAMHVIFRM